MFPAQQSSARVHICRYGQERNVSGEQVKLAAARAGIARQSRAKDAERNELSEAVRNRYKGMREGK